MKLRVTRARFVKTVAIGLLAAMIASCSDSEAEPSTKTQGPGSKPYEATLAMSSLTILMGLPLVAQDAGFFKKHGLNVKEVVANSASDAVNIALSGDADFLMTAAPAVFQVNAGGQQMRFLADAYSGLAASVVLTPEAVEKTGVAPDAAIEERLKALDGLKMSFASPSSGYLTVMQNALKLVGVSIRPVYIEQASMPTALKQGKIDALIASPPVSDIAIRDGGVLWISGPKNDLPPSVQPPMTTAAVAMQKYIDDNPEAVKRFIAALQDASIYIQDKPDEARDLVRKRFPELDEALFNASWAANETAFGSLELSTDILERQRASMSKEDLTPAIAKLKLDDLISEYAPRPS